MWKNNITIASDYFTENFQAKVMKMKMKNTYPRIFYLRFEELRFGFALGFRLGLGLW